MLIFFKWKELWLDVADGDGDGELNRIEDEDSDALLE